MAEVEVVLGGEIDMMVCDLFRFYQISKKEEVVS
jgi:hypothetical protein